MATAVLAARILLAAVFALAAVTKLRDRAGTVTALREFGVPARAAGAGARILPVAELAVAVALLVTPAAIAGAVAAVVLLVAFIGGIVNVLRQHRAPDCGCFGNFSPRPVSWWTVARNGALLVVAAFIAVEGPGASGGLWAPIVVAVAVVVAVATGGRVGPVDGGEEAVERWWRERSGIKVGERAPGFELPGACGGAGSLASLAAAGLPIVLVFLDGGCGVCTELYPHLGRWQTTLSERLTIAVVASGQPEIARRLCDEHGIRNALFDDGSVGLSTTYRMPGTPSAVALDPDGRIARRAVLGQDAIEELVRQTIRPSAPRTEPWKQPSPVA